MKIFVSSSPKVRVWDALAWMTVIFPLATGGIWIRRAGFFLELSQINVPVLMLGLFALLLSHMGEDLTQASSVRLFQSAWKLWRKNIERHEKRTLWITAIILGLSWGLVSICRHEGMESGATDLGIFINAIWNFVNGNGYVSSVKDGMNLYSDHQSPIFLLTAPLFAAMPSPWTLFLIQGIGLCLGGVALFYLGRQYLRKDQEFLYALPLLYWAYEPLRNANRFDFHPEVFMLPLFLWGIWGVQEHSWYRRLSGIFALILALGAKESAGPVAVGISMAWIFGAAPPDSKKFTRRFACLFALLGIGLFYFNTKIVPGLFGRNYEYQYNFGHFGKSTVDVILAPFFQTKLFLQTLLGFSRVKFFFLSLLPLSFLPIFAPAQFMASLPGYLMLFLSGGDHRMTLGYHYVIEPSIGLFWALPMGFSKIATLVNARLKLDKKILFAPILFFALVHYGHSDFFFFRFYELTPHKKWAMKEVVPSLDDSASIAASGGFVPHITMRAWAHYLPVIEMKGGRYVSCVVEDTQIFHSEMSEPQREELQKKLARLNYRLEYECGSLKIWHRADAPERCLKWPPKCPDKI